ncbi:MAG: TSUP family transporter [Clostridia bacterium]|nr:TSUP family transporter [Clostridia bacterium]
MKRGAQAEKTLFLRGDTRKKLVIISIGGALAGFCNGLLGAGGGIIAVLALSAVLPRDEESRRSLYANALCIMLPLSVLTLVTYAVRGRIPSDFLAGDYVGILLGGVIGGLLGAVVLGKLKSDFTDRLFAVLTVISGVLMIV